MVSVGNRAMWKVSNENTYEERRQEERGPRAGIEEGCNLGAGAGEKVRGRVKVG